MKNDWNPALYRRFEAERTRPAQELLARINLSNIARVADLGCGPGNSTELLHTAWPAAQITGIDYSPAMLEQARKRLPQCHFEQADITHWQAAAPLDLIYANASLQWLDKHERLIPYLLTQLTEQGALALQMPDNLDEPSHQLMRDVAALPQWHEQIQANLVARSYLLSAQTYYDLIVKNGFQADIWRTTYYHVMPSAAAIIEWLRATGLRPYLAALTGEQQPHFLAEYLKRVSEAYPVRADGSVLLAFPRLFIIASR